MKYHDRQSGVSLVEVLVAVAVSSILLAGVVQIFLSTRQAYNTMDAASQLQEDGRFALNFLSRDLQQTGYYGCNSYQLKIDNLLTGADGTPQGFYLSDIGEPIMGFEADAGVDLIANGAFDADMVDNTVPDPGSDVLAVRVPLGQPFTLFSNIETNNTSFTANVRSCTGAATDDLQAGQVVVIADCQWATAIQAGTVNCPTATRATVNLSSGSFQWDYNANLTEVNRMETRVYYVGQSESEDVLGNRIPTLFRRTLRTLTDGSEELIAEELIRGVEDMQVSYGVDTDINDGEMRANMYQDADDVANWNDVVSVRMNLRIRSVEPVRDDEELGERYLSHDYNSTIVLRNRMPVP